MGKQETRDLRAVAKVSQMAVTARATLSFAFSSVVAPSRLQFATGTILQAQRWHRLDHLKADTGKMKPGKSA